MTIKQRAGSYKKILFFAMLCALFTPLSMTGNALAQTEISITAQSGLGGFCKDYQWMPLKINIENNGADINARVQASYKNNADGKTISGVDIALPATSRKEFFLYIMTESLMRDFTVSVMDGSTLIAKTKLNVQCAGDPTLLFGILADTPSNYTVLNNVQAMTEATKVVQLKINDLPDQAQGWGALNALVISNVDTGTLSSQQKQALELWLAGGGKLFVTGGIQWQSTAAGLSNLLPIQPTHTKKSTLTALSDYVLEEGSPLEGEADFATGDLQTGANILVEQNSAPLLAEKEIGFGKVYYFAADPGLQPLSDWGGMKTIYKHLLAFKSPKPSWSDKNWDLYSANYALATLPELTLPPFLYICGWLGFYIISVGPANYLILRRIKRTELSWVTVPVLVILFTSLAYFSGYAYRGTKPILNRIMLMQGWQGVKQAQANALVGVYSPTRTTYNVESQNQFLIYPFDSTYEDLQGDNNWVSLKTDSGNIAPNIRVEIGGMKSVSTEGFLPSLSIQHNLAYILTEKTPVLMGSITNTSGHTLKNTLLITPGGWETLGEFAPNENKKVKVTQFNGNGSNANRYTLTTALGWDSLSNDQKEQQRHSQFFQAVNTSYTDTINANAGIYLMAWIDDEIPVPITLQSKETKQTDTLFYIEKLTPTLEIQSEKIMLTSGVYGWESSLGDTLITNSNNLQSGGYNIRFQPSLPIHFSRVDGLTFNIGTNNMPQQVHPNLWNFQTKIWQPFALNSYGGFSLPNASQYVGMDGEILLNIQGDTNSYFDVTSIDFSLMVQP